ncbi:MAG: sugar transferase [Muribaculaceae bacterium]|nr:sugar transferase [Muribaculaceae bacterium]
MIGKHISRTKQRARYVVMDYVTTSLAFFIFNIFRFNMLDLEHLGYDSLWEFIFSDKLIIEQGMVPVACLAIYWISGYYNEPLRKSRLSELITTVGSALFCTLLLFFALLINDTTGVKLLDYEILLTLFGLLVIFVYAGRRILTRITLRQLKERRWLYSSLIVGHGPKSRKVYRTLKESGSVWAYDVIGFVDLHSEFGGSPIEIDASEGLPVWKWDQIEEVAANHEIDQFILAPEALTDDQLMQLLKPLFPLNKPVKIAPDTLSFVTGNIRLDDIHAVPFIDLTSPRISEYQRNVKRTLDVLLSALGLIIASPVMLVAAIGVKLSSPGPVVYRQERIGKGRRAFKILKFRSMRNDAEKDGPRLSSDNDSRITDWGRIMRKYRIDELPQLWNIIRGEMSLVGPRPERLYYIEQIVERAPYYGLVFQVQPGLTSWGMVKHGYASTIEEMVDRSQYDLLYLNNMSLTTDFKIMLHTINTVIKGKGK